MHLIWWPIGLALSLVSLGVATVHNVDKAARLARSRAKGSSNRAGAPRTHPTAEQRA